MSKFNLLDEDWIPCTRLAKGERGEISLRQALFEAPLIREVYGETPPETASLYRLFLAVLYSTFRPFDETRWKKFWMAQHWDTNRLDAHLAQIHHRFYLFDTEYPFFQSVALDRPRETVSSLQSHIASGADATLFDHTTTAKGYAVTPAQAARALVAIQSFGLSGTKGPEMTFSDAPCARGAILLVRGKNLFETLMLNLLDLDLPSYRLGQKSNDKPAWEMDDPFTENPHRPFGYLDYLTWHNRRVRLCEPETDGLVREMMYEPGLKIEREVFNPLMFWRAAKAKSEAEVTDEEDDESANQREKRSHSPLRFQEEKALWRDSVTILSAKRSREGDKGDKPLASFQMIENLIADQVPYLEVGQTYYFDALGLCSKLPHDKTFFYRAETMPLPLTYLNHSQAKKLLLKMDEAMRVAQDVEKKLVGAIKKLATLLLAFTADHKKGRKPDAKDVKRLQRSWDTTSFFWSSLELPFRELLVKLPVDPDAALVEWHTTLRRLAWQAFEQAADLAGEDARAHKGVVAAEAQLRGGLNKVLPKPTSLKGETK